MLNTRTMSRSGIGRGSSLIRAGLLEYWPAANGMIGTIGESSITLTTGTATDLMAASWQFPDTDVTQQVDTLLGGGVLFTVRFGYQWYALFNDDYAWIGPRGIVFYNQSMAAFASKIQRYLGYYIPETEYALNPDASEMLNPDSSYAQNPA